MTASLLSPVRPVGELGYAARLLDVAERVRDLPDLPALLSALVREAGALISADSVVIVHHAGNGRSTQHVHGSASTRDPAALSAAAAYERWLLAPGLIPDLARDARWARRRAELATVSWRSVLTVPLHHPGRGEQIRLSWISSTPDAFADTGLADLFGRHADLAIHALDERANLTLAVAARHRIGTAQGILMNQHQLSADDAFLMLLRQSQHTNTKIKVIADHIIDGARATHP